MSLTASGSAFWPIVKYVGTGTGCQGVGGGRREREKRGGGRRAREEETGRRRRARGRGREERGRGAEQQRTLHAVELAAVAAGAEEVADDEARVERAVLGVDGRDLLLEECELGGGRPDREAGRGWPRSQSKDGHHGPARDERRGTK